MARLKRLASSGGGPPGRRLHTDSAPEPDEGLLRDFLTFSQRQYDCLDYDPFHPMVVELGRGLPQETVLWLSILYMAYYNIGSAYVAFCNSDPVTLPPDWCLRLPIGVQRRNLRGGRLVKHLSSCVAAATRAGSLTNLLTAGFDGDSRHDWTALKAALDSLWGNGRWSTYTTAELLQKAGRLSVLPWEITNEGSSGPRAGLGRLYGRPNFPVEELDRLADALFAVARSKVSTRIYYLSEGHYDHAMLESQLCDFNSMLKGRYYVGRDIDRDQERINAAAQMLRLMGRDASPLRAVWETRARVFHRDYLGEYQGWLGRTEYANSHYKKTGQVAGHKEILECLPGVLF